MDTSQLLSSASFLMSHDAATGYIKRGSLGASGMTWQYSKNQIGNVYQQLDDGARALDLRPKLLTNGTVIFQHGDINVKVTLDHLLADAVRWAADNNDELVLILSSDFAYQTSTTGYNTAEDDYYDSDNDEPVIVTAMAAIYEQFSIPYYDCTEVYDKTIAEILEIAALPTGGYLLAIDGQDYYGTPCAKPNWVSDQLVSCYSQYDNTTLSCRRQNPTKLAALQEYILASANNEATEDKNVLGPPASLYNYPLNEIQAFWQVSTASALIGVSRLSSILEDNRKSQWNQELVSLIHEESFDSISVLAVDNVHLNGNAILSVLRTACGQSAELGENDCGSSLAKPDMVYFHFSKLAAIVVSVLIVLWIGIAIGMAIRNREEELHPRLLWTTFARLYDQVVVSSTITTTDAAVSRAHNKEELLS